jgi:hypothetical protein
MCTLASGKGFLWRRRSSAALFVACVGDAAACSLAMAIADVVEAVCGIEVDSVCVLDPTSVTVVEPVRVVDTTSVDDTSPPSVFAPALIGFEAIGVKPGGAGTVYGVGATVTAGAVTVYCCVSYTVSYAVELTYTMPVLVGIPSNGNAVSVTMIVCDSVSVSTLVPTVPGQYVLYTSGFSMKVVLKLVALVVVGTLVSWRGPYVDLHVISDRVVDVSDGDITDCSQPIATTAQIVIEWIS